MKKVITEKQVLEALKTTKIVELADKNTLITPLAKDTAKLKGVTFQVKNQQSTSISSSSQKPTGTTSGGKTIAIGSDHGGFSYKTELIPFLKELGYSVIDVGCNSESSVDYPDFAYAVGRSVQSGKAEFGIMIDGAGIGSAMVCNKIPGILAACCYNEFTAKNAREHNHANVLTLGSKSLGIEVCKAIIKIFLSTDADQGRHLGRVNKIKDIEAKFSK